MPLLKNYYQYSLVVEGSYNSPYIPEGWSAFLNSLEALLWSGGIENLTMDDGKSFYLFICCYCLLAQTHKRKDKQIL